MCVFLMYFYLKEYYNDHTKTKNFIFSFEEEHRKMVNFLKCISDECISDENLIQKKINLF